MSDVPFLDTNILLYAFALDEKAETAKAIVSKPFATSVQGLNEFASAARRKSCKEWTDIKTALVGLRKLATQIVVVDLNIHLAALNLVEKYNFNFYDALMVAAALQAGSTTFLSEDMQNGLIVESRLTIVNPFLPAQDA